MHNIFVGIPCFRHGLETYSQRALLIARGQTCRNMLTHAAKLRHEETLMQTFRIVQETHRSTTALQDYCFLLRYLAPPGKTSVHYTLVELF